MVTGQFAALDAVYELERNKDTLALLCLNDDVVDEGLQVDMIFRIWFKQRWYEHAEWEKQ